MMNRYLKIISSAPLLALCIVLSSANAQTVTLPPIASNIPATLTASIDSIGYRGVGNDANPTATVNGGTTPYGYLWSSDAANITINNASTATPSFSITQDLDDELQANPNLALFLEATDDNSCLTGDSMPLYNIVVALDQFNTLDADLSIFPNPSNGVLTVSLQGKPTGQSMELVVLDVTGRRVHSERLGRFQGTLTKELDLSELSAGAYYLGFQSEGKQVFKKLMIH